LGKTNRPFGESVITIREAHPGMGRTGSRYMRPIREKDNMGGKKLP
jgi:hypothetical protein